MFTEIIEFIIVNFLVGLSSDWKDETDTRVILEYLQSVNKHVELIKYLREKIYRGNEFYVSVAAIRKFIDDRPAAKYPELEKIISRFNSMDCKFSSPNNLPLIEAKLLADVLRDNYESYRHLKAVKL